MKKAPTTSHAAAKLSILISGNVLMTFMISAVMPASGAIAHNFTPLGHADMRAQAVLLAPYVAMIFIAPLSGVLIQLWGRRTPLLAAFALYALAGGTSLFIDGFWPLILARVLLGVAGGAITTICMTLAGDYFIGSQRTWAVALVGMAPAPGSVAVLLVAGILVDWGGWHLAFAPYLLAIPVFLAALFIITEPEQSAELAETSGALPRRFFLLCGVTMFEACIAILPAIELPFLLIGIGVHNATVAAILIALGAAVAVATGSLYPLMRRYIPVNTILVLIFAVAAIACFGLAHATSVVSIGICLLINGFPTGMMIPHFSALAIERSSAEARGRAVGLVTSSIFLGQVLIPFVSEPLRASLGMRGMFTALALLLVGAAFTALAAPKIGLMQHAAN